MNKAFVREPDFDGRAYCPGCKSLGEEVSSQVLDTQIKSDTRTQIGDAAWFCPFATCEVAYFDLLGSKIATDDLRQPIYPKDPDASMCACFKFSYDDILADVADEIPQRIRSLLTRSQSPEARCHALAPNGQCCLREVQRLFLRLRASQRDP